IQTPDSMETISGSVPIHFRDYSKEKPVNDLTFKIFLRQFNYDKTDFNEHIEHLKTENKNIAYERIIIDAAYGDERLPMYLFLPENGKPPYQTIIHFRSTYPFTINKDSDAFMDRFAASSPLYKNGRAVLIPVYKGSFERSDGKFMEEYFNNMESTNYKDLMIMWNKDIGRCIDYLETRDDIDTEKLAYYGVSLGAANGAIIPAVEKRIKTAVLTVAGLWHANIFPEVDQINFLPRVTIPVLMINGKYDHIFPMESSQKPMFELLGTPPENKKQFIYEHGHHIPNNIIIRETLNWLDTDLGPVGPGNLTQ
ncbi:MAG: hypothetical protein KAI29_19955, partial [Cyclobacteriaceae bacterium]|nr:hypothetical protein [Cyclobacteriaceae bacterium]